MDIKFDQAAYNDCDHKAKHLLFDILKTFGFTEHIDIDKELYRNGDVVVKDPRDGKIVIWECEVRDPKYYDKIVSKRFKTVHVPYRKKSNPADYYVVFSKRWDEMLIMKMENVKKSPVIRDMMTTRGEDSFFDVDLNHVKRYKIKGNLELIYEAL